MRATIRALQESEARYRTMLQTLGEGVVVQDRDGRIVEANAEAERILGLRREDLAGLTSFDPRWQSVHEDGSPFPGETHPAMVTLRTGQSCRGVVMRVNAGPRIDRWLLINSEPLMHPGKAEPQGVVVSFSDITDVHRAQEEFRSLADNSPDFIVRYDRDCRRLYANRAIADAYGVSPEQLIGDAGGSGTTAMTMEPAAVARLRAGIREVFEHGTTRDFDLPYSTPDREGVTHCRLVPEFDADGKVADVLAIGRDVTELVTVTQELAERERRYRDIFENTLDSMFLLEVLPDGEHFRNLEINPALERSTGVPRAAMIGRTIDETVPPETAALVNEKYRRCVAAGVPIEEDVVLDLPAGRRWYHSTLIPARDDSGRVNRIIGITRDITERVEFERALSDSEERFRLAFEGSLVGMAQVAVDSAPRYCHLRVNRAMCDFLGRSEEELVGLRQADVMWPDDADPTDSAFDDLLSGRITSYRAERRFRHPRDGLVWGLLSAIVVRDAEGEPLFVLSQVEDITARKRAEEQLVHRALHDDLTGLPNRALLMEHLGNALTRARRNGSLLAVLFLDLDDFKSVNDSFGHGVGDEFLVRVAGRIRNSVRASDTAARVGGDEFVVVCEDLADPDDASVVATQVQRALAAPIPLRDHAVTAPVSIGIALSREDSTPEHLLRDADAAMYVAKHRGGRRWEAADASMHAAAIRILTLEAELRRAVERDELRLHYQPVIDLRDGTVVCVEALLRWQHPERGLLLPGEFVDVAEQRGLVSEIGAWVLRTACARAGTWHQRLGERAPRLAVNVSSRQLGDQGLSTLVREALGAGPLPADRLFLEVTESQLLMAGTSAATDLRTLSRCGVRIAVDDFGTGYAGFDYLRRLPVDELKIDRSFVGGLGNDPTDTAITASIVALGLNLGLTVVAEGIETPAQRERLAAMGCTWGQGWLWHRALPPEEIDALLV